MNRQSHPREANPFSRDKGRQGIFRGAILALLCAASLRSAPASDPLFSESMGDSEIRARILDLVPALGRSNAEPIEKIRALRGWLHQAVPAAGPSTDVAFVVGRSHHELSTSEMLALAERGEAGVMCGGHAELMRRLSRLFGFEAVTMNFAVPETDFSHEVSVVKIARGGFLGWYVQDSYLNSEYQNLAGEPLTFDEVVYLLRNGRAGEIHESIPAGNQRPVLIRKNDSSKNPVERGFIPWSLKSIIEQRPDLALNLRRMAGTDHPAAILIFPTTNSGEREAQQLASLARWQGRSDILAAPSCILDLGLTGGFAYALNTAVNQPTLQRTLTDGPKGTIFFCSSIDDHAATEFVALPKIRGRNVTVSIDNPEETQGYYFLQTDAFANVGPFALPSKGRLLHSFQIDDETKSIRLYFQSNVTGPLQLPKRISLFLRHIPQTASGLGG